LLSCSTPTKPRFAARQATSPPVHPNLDPGQAERLCREALAQPDRYAALRWLHTALPSLDTRLPGLRNEGFLATHELEVIRKGRKLDWDASAQRARPALANQGDALLKGLGFTTERVDQVTQSLRASANGQRVAVAVLLRQE